MTQMSDLHPTRPTDRARNLADSQARSRLARRLHHSSLRVKLAVVLTAVGLAACVIPPSLEVGGSDAAINSPPAITSIRTDGQELPPNSTVNFNVSDTPTMNVDVIDTDLGDTLYVRAFVDYNPNNALDARSKCVAPPAADHPTADRSTTCDLRSLCVASDVGVTHDLSVVVFDREPLDKGAPAFQAMPPGGLATSVFYHLDCHTAAP